MAGQNNRPIEKRLQPGTTKKDLDQFIDIHHKSRFSSRNRIYSEQKPDAFDDSEYNNYCNESIISEDRRNYFSIYLKNYDEENSLAENSI